MITSRALLVGLAVVCVGGQAIAQQGTYVAAFPSVSVADGRSTTTISATVRDTNGRLVADGTKVGFTSTLGQFRQSIVTTSSGVARAVLVAGGVPGIAQVTVTALTPNAAPTTIEFEFVADRKLLASAQEYIEVVTTGAMQYSNDTYSKLMSASSPDHGVSIRYRDIQVDADDVQIDIPNSILRAKRAHLKFGKINQDFEQLYLRLNQRRGIGTTSYYARRYDTITWGSHGPEFLRIVGSGPAKLAEDEKRFGLVEITGGSFKPANQALNTPIFDFDDTSSSPSTVRARKAVIFPRKGIQFQKAEVYVGTTRVMAMPLFELNLYSSSSPIVTDQFVSVANNHLAVNYPYYLTLKPGTTSLLRLRTGEQYGRSTQVNQGVFLDYELNWNHGDLMDGGMTFSGLGRNDWSLGAHQYLQIDDRSKASFQAEMPSGKSLYGSASVDRMFNGFQVNMNGSTNQSLRGLPFRSTDLSLNAEKDPTKFGRLPVQMFYGLTAQYSSNSLLDRVQQGSGPYARIQSLPINLGKLSTVNASFSAKHLFGDESTAGLALAGEATVTRTLSPDASVIATYNYTRDRYSDALVGSHRLSLQGYYSAGRTGLQLFATKSLDVDRLSLYGDLGYRLSPIWRLATGYTYDSYPTIGNAVNQYLDYNFSVNYRLGWRELGLTWSRQTGHIGFQILGATSY
jgi:Invasin, domain 3